MKIIAMELSTARGSIAVRHDEETVFAADFANDRKHSGAFFEQLQRCVAEHRSADRIVVGTGPGSYAGTRIAIAAANGLQAATGARLIGLPSVCALPVDSGGYVAIGDARRHTFYFARVSGGCCIEGPLLCAEEELHERIDRADVPVFASESLPAFPDASIEFPSAAILAMIAARSDHPEAATLEPIYLRDPHITWPKTKPPVASATP